MEEKELKQELMKKDKETLVELLLQKMFDCKMEEQQLVELKEKAIFPKFRTGQKVWSIFVGDYKEICYLEITHIMKSKNGIFYQDNNNNAYWFNEKNTFLTEQEAQAKLKEIQGNE